MRSAANALAVETDEAPVSSNELLEVNVIAIRADLIDLKAEFRAVVARIDQDIRAMAAKAESEIKTAVARIDEQFREVRQDIRELRAGVNGLQADNKTLRDKIDATRESLDKKIDTTRESLDKKIDTKFDELRADMKEMRASIGDLKGMQKAILWLLGSILALVTMAGAGFQIAKTLHWL
jgi:peptidoglycan hydrolase CwlO-like protein